MSAFLASTMPQSAHCRLPEEPLRGGEATNYLTSSGHPASSQWDRSGEIDARRTLSRPSPGSAAGPIRFILHNAYNRSLSSFPASSPHFRRYTLRSIHDIRSVYKTAESSRQGRWRRFHP